MKKDKEDETSSNRKKTRKERKMLKVYEKTFLTLDDTLHFVLFLMLSGMSFKPTNSESASMTRKMEHRTIRYMLKQP